MSGFTGAGLSFKVLSGEPSWLIFQRITLAAEENITEKSFKWGYDWMGGPRVAAMPATFVKGQIVRATVLWSPIWQEGASLSANSVLERCRPG